MDQTGPPAVDERPSVEDLLRARDALWAAQIRRALGADLDRVVDACDHGEATAAKRGRNPQFPYVPVLRFTDAEGFVKRTEQLRGLAYVTREEAVQRAQRQIDADRVRMAERLCDPGARAWRESLGLPREPVPRPPMPSTLDGAEDQV